MPKAGDIQRGEKLLICGWLLCLILLRIFQRLSHNSSMRLRCALFIFDQLSEQVVKHSQAYLLTGHCFGKTLACLMQCLLCLPIECVTLDKAIERSSKAHQLGGKLFASKRK